MKLFDSPTAQY